MSSEKAKSIKLPAGDDLIVTGIKIPMQMLDPTQSSIPGKAVIERMVGRRV